ncbi:hypothetical protein DES53_105104 [Roseimicrobium gellanilyticum]|uniref:Uncharacterized protein n=1 Tax=Roseimicrobium gellanilyticum TaxID=748857 RepID=A0A366HNZ8_9BACT|nr:hypothetical protein [Roseimicrobium gellanilyticum]RBP43705.1 hypothetical protein DES53_105104 [Roseimicrobium gellanilyticum]
MALTWQVTQQDTLRIQDRANGGPVIWVCAGILLLVGAKFGWWLLLALGEMARAVLHADFGYMFTYIFGLILLVVMTAAFVLPGLWMLFARSVVEVHPAEGYISEMRDYVAWRKTKRHEISEVSAVRGTHEVSQNRSNSTVEKYRLDVTLKGKGTNEFLAAQPDTRERAQELGALIAAKIGVPFLDHTLKRDSYEDFRYER